MMEQTLRDDAKSQQLSAKMLGAKRARLPTVGEARRRMTSTATSATHHSSDDAAPANESDRVRTDLGDEESIRGRFGWTVIGNMHIPYIIRSGVQYCAVRMLELRILRNYLTTLHPDVYACARLPSYYVTDAECRLLNEINREHCEHQFGPDDFLLRDRIVQLPATIEFYQFVSSCYTMLTNAYSSCAPALDLCGFMRINGESVVPYTVSNGVKYVPLFYFEGETETLQGKAQTLNGWPLCYLKFCCKVQGIRNELFADESCAVIDVADVQRHFPPQTKFEEYWPSKVVAGSSLLINGTVSTQMGQWTQLPAGASKVSMHANVAYPTLGARNAHAPRRTYAASSAKAARASTTPTAANNQMPQPPPLIRADQLTASTNNHPKANYMMKNHQNVANHTYRPVPPTLLNRPPPLIAVRQANGAPSSHSPTITNQQSHTHAPLASHPPNDRIALTNGHPPPPTTLPSHPTVLDPIPPTATTTPYKMERALIENQLIPCVNMKPYTNTDLLTSISHVSEQLFNGVSAQYCYNVCKVLGMSMYKASGEQMEVLRAHVKSGTVDDLLPLVHVRQVRNYYPQIKYMLGGPMGAGVTAKRGRTS